MPRDCLCTAWAIMQRSQRDHCIIILFSLWFALCVGSSDVRWRESPGLFTAAKQLQDSASAVQSYSSFIRAGKQRHCLFKPTLMRSWKHGLQSTIFLGPIYALLKKLVNKSFLVLFFVNMGYTFSGNLYFVLPFQPGHHSLSLLLF